MAAAANDWIQILQGNRLQPYFWNLRTGETSYDPIAVEWIGTQDPSTSRYYFWKVGTSKTTYQLPPLAERTSIANISGINVPPSCATTHADNDIECEDLPNAVLHHHIYAGSSNDGWIKIEPGIAK